jgi:predicted permease
MFSIVRSVLLKPLPFPGSERIVYLYNSYPNAGAPRVGAAVPDYFDRLQAVPALDQQALFRQEGMTFGDDNSSERLVSIRATPSFYRLVRVVPELGRVFEENEGEVGRESKVILSRGFWIRRFGGDKSIVGKTIRLNGNPFDVVGVMPLGFTFLQNDVDLFLPAAFPPAAKADNQRHSNNWQMIGRLKEGASIDLVRQQVDALNIQNDQLHPEFRQVLKDAHFRTISVFLQDDVVRDVKAGLYLLWGCVLFVLVIGCVNIANLVIVRSSGRTREMATRHAIGGDLSRLARQLLTETTLLSLAGGAIGVLLGWYALRSVSVLNLDQLPRGYEIAIDPVTVAVILALTLAVGVAIGVAPVVRLRRMNLNVELREENRGGTSGRRANLVRRGLATLQVAIALVLGDRGHDRQRHFEPGPAAPVRVHTRHDRRTGPGQPAVQPDFAAAGRRSGGVSQLGRAGRRVRQQLRSVSDPAEHELGGRARHRRAARIAGRDRVRRLHQYRRHRHVPHRRAERQQPRAAKAAQSVRVSTAVRHRRTATAGAGAPRASELQHDLEQRHRAK